MSSHVKNARKDTTPTQGEEFILTEAHEDNGTVSYSGQLPLRCVLKKTKLSPLESIDYDQKGINRALNTTRAKQIAIGKERLLAANQIVEDGVLILGCDTDLKEIGVIHAADGTRVLRMGIEDKSLSAADRQHSIIGVHTCALNNPASFPQLNKRIESALVTVKIIKAPCREMRNRVGQLNTGAKPHTPAEKLMVLASDALATERDGGNIGHYKDRLPEIVAYLAWRKTAENPESVWYQKLIVGSVAALPAPTKRTVSIAQLVSETIAVYRTVRKMETGFGDWQVMEQADYVAEIIHGYWRWLGQHLPAATGEHWHKFVALKHGARLLAKVLAGLLEVFLEKSKHRLSQEDAWLKDMSLREFWEIGIVDQFLNLTDAGSPYKNDDYWSEDGVGLVAQEKAVALRSIWRQINVHKWKQWQNYCTSANTNPATNRARDLKQRDEKQLRSMALAQES